MIERRGGAIITISSGATRSGGHYSATKRAVEAMTIGLANELRDKSIAVNCLQPTLSIRTPGALFAARPSSGWPTRDSAPKATKKLPSCWHFKRLTRVPAPSSATRRRLPSSARARSGALQGAVPGGLVRRIGLILAYSN